MTRNSALSGGLGSAALQGNRAVNEVGAGGALEVARQGPYPEHGAQSGLRLLSVAQVVPTAGVWQVSVGSGPS